eukprot:CAMPEP_0168446978 /NCGR_PEP_ID=MMETSP0228-20121227/46356_1 /TAXON_ID=133427 /ORGANISM="Protoceratium reticulatum, Strain CCCM 535 (=CCMP 1889)" /LENGTH=47 /DNA_ID= /DNA_START= /DNA_END= /DNA_ORIENTATION=
MPHEAHRLALLADAVVSRVAPQDLHVDLGVAADALLQVPPAPEREAP